MRIFDNLVRGFALGIFISLSSEALAGTSSASASLMEKAIPIDSVITKDALKSDGLMTYYLQGGRHLLEIPDKILNRDILVTVTITKGAWRKERKEDMRFGYGGDSMYDKMIRLTKNNGRIDVTIPEIAYQGNDKSIYKNYYSQLVAPVAKSLKIIATGRESSLVDITDWMMDDDALFSLKGGASTLKLGAAQPQYTQIVSVKAFPENINFTSSRSYMLKEPATGEQPISQWEVCSSWMLLPEKPMTPRLFDPRVGFFNYNLLGLSTHDDRSGLGSMAARWRLEPKDEDKERYLRGELVEPKTPIIYYIDPATPKFLQPYFIRAVNAWQKAFERAGFKNAIHAEMAPANADYSQGDARYPLISYKASPIPNAYGPMVVDPRSGEIITTHIGIYHSVLELIQRWYFTMCSPTDAEARKYPMDRELMGRLAETVLCHEVGHTLGLRHDFMGSTCYPADSLRSSLFIKRNGLGASIMDYQRFNYVAQPGDKMDPEDLLPRIGEYDLFAIEWGYRWKPDGDLRKQTEELHQWTTMQRAKDKRHLYIEERTLGDPRVQSEDSSDDDIRANTYGMKNLQYIMQHLEEWTPVSDDDYYVLTKRYHSVLNQYWNYIGHVMKYVAGHYDDNADRDEQLLTNVHVPKQKQMEALDFLNEWLMKDQQWLHPARLMEKTGVNPTQDMMNAAHQLGILLLKYSALNTQSPQDDDLDPVELIDYIYNKVYREKNLQAHLSEYDMGLQKEMLSNLTMNAENLVAIQFTTGTVLKQVLERVKADALRKAARESNFLQRNHHQAVASFVTIWQQESNRGLLGNK
ncbi:MAG: zinc-dependent metalloprotease [Prevotella sp.]|nr:zinc-dependent metalloprotease [Prevotella sp.]